MDQILCKSDLPKLSKSPKIDAHELMPPSNGLSASKLKNTSASVADVLSGKTFYAGDKNLKTGTMANHGAWSGTFSGGNVGIPAGYHNGAGYVGVAGGSHGAWSTTINPGGSVAIPQGFHNGAGRVYANNVQSQLKTASFNLSLNSGGVAYGETKDAWWNPGGTVIGMTRCQIRTDTESGEASANWTRCTVENGQIHFVNSFTHRGGQAYASGDVVFI